MREINLNRQLLGLEDLAFGTGTVEQTRAGTKVNVTKINAGNLPFDETRTFIEFAQEVNLEELGNSVEAINNLNNDLDKILIVEDNLPIINNVEAIKDSIVTLDTNILALQNIDINMSSINTVEDNLPEVVSVAQNIVPNLTEILNVDTLASQVTQDKASISSMKLAVETIYDTFDDRFLGTKTTNPTLDNDGNVLIDGAMYFNTTDNTMKVYDVGTTAWYSIPQIYLSSLLDVQLTSVTMGNILVWNGTKWINYTLSKSDVGLSLVDNTSDANKPVSTAVQTALNLKAPLTSAALVNPMINGIAQSGYSGFKNYIINGAFDIWQRGTTAAISGNTYLADRFHAWHSAGGTLVKSEGVIGYYNSLKVAGSSSGAAVVGQRIEAINSIKLGIDGNYKVAVSMYVKSNVASSGSIILLIPTAIDNFTTTTAKYSAINITTGWTKVSATFDLDFVYWGGLGVYLQCDNCTDFYTTGWQLEEGSVATPLEQRPYGLELSLCQRYCFVKAAGINITLVKAGGTWQSTSYKFPTTMRVEPTVTIEAYYQGDWSGLGSYANKDEYRLSSNNGNLASVELYSFTASAEL